MIPRFYKDLGNYLKRSKVLVLYGARQVGKTTLVREYLKTTDLKYRYDTGDNTRLHALFETEDFRQLIDYGEGYQLIVIDEAQRVPKIGQGLKILVDHCPDLYFLVTGSSSFELAGQLGEPLTGRKRTLHLYPIAQLELKQKYSMFDLKERLHDFLVYGSYPEVLLASSAKEKISLINELAHSYLFKDILELDRIKSSKPLLDLLRLLAFQIGSEVSLTELGSQLNLDYKTVARYLDLLEKGFVIYRLAGFSRNLRKEITKKFKYYFFDNGIRNALISNFNSLELRNDIGQLWENFLMIERLKKRAYQEIFANDYFWRTWDRKELDLVEEREGSLFGYEFKWQGRKRKIPKMWLETYPEAKAEIISRENYFNFIS